MASNDISTAGWRYHVFLSFRGEDTRKGFTTHLYDKLKQKRIETFMDDTELNRGEVISQTLIKAIEESLFSVVILSPNYASSAWCLDELQKIIEAKNVLNRGVFPVFWGVDPSDVRHQTGNFAEAFEIHEEKYRNQNGKVQRWRDAMTEVGHLAGWDSKNWHREADLIENIAVVVLNNLRPKLPSTADILAEMDDKTEELASDFLACFYGKGSAKSKTGCFIL